MGGRRAANGDESHRGGNHSRASTEGATATRRWFLRTAAATTLAAPTLGAGVASGAEVIESAFTVESVEAGRVANGADVSYADGTVTVEGTIPAPNPCYTAALGHVGFTDDGALAVGVAAGRDGGTDRACRQVTATVRYTATVTVDERPAAVLIEHDGIGGWTRRVDLAPDTPTETPTDAPEGAVVATGEPSVIIDEAARLSGAVRSLGGADSVTAGVEYRPAGAAEWSESATTVPETGSYAVNVTGLSPGTEYEYRAVARTASGVVDRGETATFATESESPGPVVSVPRATNVGTHSASFYTGVTRPDRLTAPWEVSVRYRPVDATEWRHTDPVSASHHLEYTPSVTDLQPGTTYEFQAVATDAFGDVSRVRGEEFTTATELPPVSSDAAPTDPDGDGLYEDVNGDGEGDLADAVDLFQHRESAAVQDHAPAYDFSGNGDMTLADVVDLFQENAG